MNNSIDFTCYPVNFEPFQSLIHKSHIFLHSYKLSDCAWNYIRLCVSSGTSSFEVEE